MIQKLTAEWEEYTLVDSGDGRKLERFGGMTLVRPEAQATWAAAMPRKKWEEADGEFVKAKSGEQGAWRFRREISARWEMRRKELRFWISPAASGHVGVFPDQASHWDWMSEAIGGAGREVKALCLFGHTGLATLSAAAAGAHVTHVDASRRAVEWARENQKLSGLEKRPVRWMVEDALTFVRREARRGNRYDAMIIDPPRFGRGPDGEIWKLEESLPELLEGCGKLLSEAPVLVLLNVYVTVATRGRVEQEAERLRRQLQEMVRGLEVEVSAGELGIEDGAGRRIAGAVFARGEGTSQKVARV